MSAFENVLSQIPLFCPRKRFARPVSDRDQTFTEAIQAMRDFCKAVEAGTIHSRNTYARFKEILRRYDAL